MTIKPPHFIHQEEEWRHHRYAVARAYLWQMRTGKTRMAVESACALADSLSINGVLVIAPNGVHRQWAEEQIPMWSMSAHDNIFAWRFVDPDNQKNFELWRLFWHTSALQWFCVNMEALIRREIREAITQFKDAVGPTMLIVDESHHFARPGAKRTGVARGLKRHFEYRRILTGTSVENSPFQAFSQFEILDKGALGHTTYGGTPRGSVSGTPCPTCGSRCRGFKHEFGEFELERRGGHMVAVLSGYKNKDVLKKRMAEYSSVVLRSECDDLPELQHDRRIVEMTERQVLKWKAVKEQIVETEDDKVFTGGAALVKMQQVEGGFFIKRDGTIEDLCGDDNPKMLILEDEITWHDGQVIVWFEYLHEIDAAARFLRQQGVTCGVFSGRAKATDRDRDLAAFMAGKLRVLLSQPRAGGEGRNMSAASKIIWYSHTFDAVTRSQANERATMMGGKSVQIVDMSSPVGDYCLKLTTEKRTLADDISRHGLKKVLEDIKLGRR